MGIIEKFKKHVSLWVGIFTLMAGVWYFCSLDRRVSVLESTQPLIISQIEHQNNQLVQQNTHQDESISKLQDQMNQRFDQLKDNIQQILIFITQEKLAKK